MYSYSFCFLSHSCSKDYEAEKGRKLVVPGLELCGAAAMERPQKEAIEESGEKVVEVMS